MNDDWLKPFPTRTGPAIGAGMERTMLNKVGGPNTIRTEIQNNPDGSTTMLRTRNGMPEFTTTPATPNVATISWAWPWHGVWRAGDNVIETIATELENKGGQLDFYNNSNFIPHAASSFAAIPAPTSSPAGATWVNWASLSSGVLMGEAVGMNTWLYTAGGKSWVVVLDFPSQFQARLNLYSLDNWVAGMPLSASANFVRYDKVPSPYMVKALPSGGLREPVATLVVNLPAYFQPPSTNVTVKRSDVSRTGSKIILAYEVRPSTPRVPITMLGGLEARLQLEDQWVEVVISGVSAGTFSATAATIRQGHDLPSVVGSTKTHLSVSSAASSGRFDSTTVISTVREGGGVLGMMYSVSDEAAEVYWAMKNTVSRSLVNVALIVTQTGTENTTLTYDNKLTITFDNHEESVHLTANGASLWDAAIAYPANVYGETTWTISTCGQTFTGVEKKRDAGVHGGVFTEQFWWMWQVNPYTGSSQLVLSNSSGTIPLNAYGYPPGHPYFNNTNLIIDETPSGFVETAAVAQFNAAVDPPVNTPIQYGAVGYARQFYYMNTRYLAAAVTTTAFNPYGGSDGDLTSFELVRDSLNHWTLARKVQEVRGGVYTTVTHTPLAHLTHQGWTRVSSGSVTKAAYELGVASNKVTSSFTYGSASGKCRRYI